MEPSCKLDRVNEVSRRPAEAVLSESLVDDNPRKTCPAFGSGRVRIRVNSSSERGRIHHGQISWLPPSGMCEGDGSGHSTVEARRLKGKVSDGFLERDL